MNNVFVVLGLALISILGLAACDSITGVEDETDLQVEQSDFFPLEKDRVWIFESVHEFSGGLMEGPSSSRAQTTMTVSTSSSAGSETIYTIALEKKGEVQESLYDPYESRYARGEWTPFEERRSLSWAEDRDSLSASGWLEGKIARYHDLETPDTLVVVLGTPDHPISPRWQTLTLVRDVGPVAYERVSRNHKQGTWCEEWILIDQR